MITIKFDPPEWEIRKIGNEYIAVKKTTLEKVLNEINPNDRERLLNELAKNGHSNVTIDGRG